MIFKKLNRFLQGRRTKKKKLSMMRIFNYTSLIISLILLQCSVFAQEVASTQKNEFRFNSGISRASLFRTMVLEEDGTTKSGIAHELGFSYSTPMDKKLWMGIGISYLKTKNMYTPPSSENQETIANLKEIEQISEMIYLPAYIKYDINPWFALKAGMSLEVAIARSDIYNQNGLGFFAAPNLHYKINNNLDIGLEPNIHFTAMLPIPQEFYQQHFFLAGANAYIAICI